MVQLEVERRNQFKQDNYINFYIIQCEQNRFTYKVFYKECGGLFGRKNWTTSRGKRPVWQCNNRYKVKGIQGCTNRHTDEKTLQQAFLRAVEILRENEEKLQEKWGNFSEDQKLEKYYAAKLKESLNSNQEEFNGRKM